MENEAIENVNSASPKARRLQARQDFSRASPRPETGRGEPAAVEGQSLNIVQIADQLPGCLSAYAGNRQALRGTRIAHVPWEEKKSF